MNHLFIILIISYAFLGCSEKGSVIIDCFPEYPNSYFVVNKSKRTVTFKFYPANQSEVIILEVNTGSSTLVAYQPSSISTNGTGILNRHLVGTLNGSEYEKMIMLFSDGKKIEYLFKCSDLSNTLNFRNLLCRVGFTEKVIEEIKKESDCGNVNSIEYTYTITKEDYQRAK